MTTTLTRSQAAQARRAQWKKEGRCDKCTMLGVGTCACDKCGLLYHRCEKHGGLDGARRSLHSHKALLRH